MLYLPPCFETDLNQPIRRAVIEPLLAPIPQTNKAVHLPQMSGDRHPLDPITRFDVQAQTVTPRTQWVSRPDAHVSIRLLEEL